ncbi:MAG: Fic family protein [Coriobacteriia bacterium]
MRSAAEGQQFLMRTRIMETIAVARLDGLTISEVEAATLLQYNRTPTNPTERLLVNTFTAFDHLAEMVDEPFSREMFENLGQMLLQGVDTASLHYQPASQGLLIATPIPGDDRSSRELAAQQVDKIADYFNGAADPDDIPVLISLLATDLFRLYRPYGIASSQIGRLTGYLFALKHDLPVLGYLPVSHAKVQWEAGLIVPPMVSIDRDDFTSLEKLQPLDGTPYQTLVSQLATLTLRDLEERIITWERHDAEMRELLRLDQHLNHRQRSILARALRDSKAEFRISYHQRNHNIHYTTARRDLLELRDNGYLTMEQRGNAFVFLRGRKLDEFDAARSEA